MLEDFVNDIRIEVDENRRVLDRGCIISARRGNYPAYFLMGDYYPPMYQLSQSLSFFGAELY
jgi:hypothetical protein